MATRDPNLPNDVDAIWLDRGQRYLVQIRRTNTVRDVRDALLGLSYLIADDQHDSVGVTVLVGTKLSTKRLHEEMGHFHQVINLNLVQRLHCVLVTPDGAMHKIDNGNGKWPLPNHFLGWLRETLDDINSNIRPAPPSASLSAIATLAQMSIEQNFPATLKSIQEISGVSYPTVVAVVEHLKHKNLIELGNHKRGVRLRSPDSFEWIELAKDYLRQRKVAYYWDPTGMCTPKGLLQVLTTISSSKGIAENVQVGGVIGASWLFPLLDVTAPMRLDLSATESPDALASLLDAGLVRAESVASHYRKPVLAIHHTRPLSLAPTVPGTSLRPAGWLECLADLLEMGYESQANEFANEMNNKARRMSC